MSSIRRHFPLDVYPSVAQHNFGCWALFPQTTVFGFLFLVLYQVEKYYFLRIEILKINDLLVRATE